MSSPIRSVPFQEGGLLIAILVLGILLTIFGGSVKAPKFETDAQGKRVRVMEVDASGQKVPAFETRNKFFNARSLAKLAKDASFVAIMAVGMTFVIVSGGIDLSVGSTYAFASVLGAVVFRNTGTDGSMLPGILACLGAGALGGFANGAMIVSLRVHPFIITLGTMAIYRGIAFVITKGQSIGGFPTSLRRFVGYEINGLSVVPLLVTIVVLILGAIYLTRMAAGRQIYAVGGNELATRYSGISVEKVKLTVFFVSGLTAGIAALMALGYYGAASSGDGQGYELNVIAAAVVGGASLTGGKGSALGAVLGALIIQMITSGIDIVGIDKSYSQIIIGGVVILAVVLDQLNERLAKARLLARSAKA
ncbi:MAG TPA: ABC transporter permease [Chthoniobacterales bacterium]